MERISHAVGPMSILERNADISPIWKSAMFIRRRADQASPIVEAHPNTAGQVMKSDALFPPSPAQPDGRRPYLPVYGVLFFAGIFLFCLRKLAGLPPGHLNDLLVMASCATCGWSWLLARALFRHPGQRESPWPLAAVILLTATGAFLQIAGGSDDPLTHMAGNLQQLLSSTVLLLAITESLRTWRRDLRRYERRFRLAFAGAYAALVIVSAVWINQSPEGSFGARAGDDVKIVCALLAMLLAGLALRYRHAHPLPAQGEAKRRPPTAEAQDLAARIRALMAAHSLHATASLKVADLAQRLDVPEYKVTLCITGALGFRNFNQMVNHWRLERAMSMLSNPRCEGLPVLSIALDCGFGSIGPFNRAFKAQTGKTPTQFRGEALELLRTGNGL
jgi:AraC-like DNA-binding protein